MRKGKKFKKPKSTGKLLLDENGCRISKQTESELMVCKILNALHIEYVCEKQEIVQDNIRFYDFFLPDLNIYIEVDGGYHNEGSVKAIDKIKDDFVLNHVKASLIRIKNSQVKPDFVNFLVNLATVESGKLFNYRDKALCNKRYGHFSNSKLLYRVDLGTEPKILKKTIRRPASEPQPTAGKDFI